MTKLLAIDHETTYEYEADVLCSSHLAHLCGRDTPRQRWLQRRFAAVPEPAALQNRIDIFGNTATAFAVECAYRRFSVTCGGLAEVGEQHLPDATPPWEEVAAAAPHDLEAAKYLFESPFAPVDATVRGYARESFAPGRAVRETAEELMHRIHADCRYAPGTTRIGDPPAAILRMRQGVCQDFAHVMVAAMRAFGIPCRYVSGYLRTYPPPGMPKLVGCDATHAWCAVWCGGDAWLELDPTNDRLADSDYPVLAWGRDFGDVSPLKGVISGGGKSLLKVAVNVNEREEKNE
ncbi:MAG: transglutaminase domain-containing protein [Kiritimatiellia bacterium]